MTTDAPTAPTPEGRAPLVGRAHELDRLTTALGESAANEELRSFLLAADAGVGKSRLVRETGALAREHGARFASGAAYEGDSGRPFGPIVDLLRAARRGATPEARASLEAALATFAGSTDNTAADPAASRWAQIDAVVDAIDVAATSASEGAPPLRVVAFEDLHWADESTLELLTNVLRQLEPVPVVVLATFRPPPPDATALLSFIDAARSLPCSERIDLGPIPSAAAEDLVRAAAGNDVSDDAVAAIVQRAAGNPLFLEEAARDASRTAREGGDPSDVARVPGAIRDLVHQRVARLPDRTREILYAFAVLGADHDPTIVGTLLDITVSEVAPAFDLLVAEDLLATDAQGRLAFRHALTRDAVYEAIPSLQRRDLHARCVDAIEAHEGQRAAAAMAAHLQQVGDVESLRRAGTLLARAGEQSLAQLAYEQAATQLRDAVRLLLDCDESAEVVRHTRLQLAESLRRTHPDDAALDAFALVADEAAAAADPTSEARAALGYEQTYLETGRARTGVDARSIPLLDRALEHLDQLPDTTEGIAPLRARLLAAGAQARHFAGDRDAALDMAHRAAEVARAASVPGAEAAALNTLRLAIAGPDSIDQVLPLTRQIVERAAEAGDVDLELEGLLWRIIALLEVGRRAESEAALARFATLAQRVRHPWRLSEMHRMQAMFAHLNGDLATARTEADTSLRFGLAAGHAEVRSPYVLLLTAVATVAEVRATVDDLLNQRTPQLTTFLWQAFVGWLTVASGDRERAARLGAMAMESGLESLPRDGGWFSYSHGFVELAIQLNEPAWAQAAYDALLPYADRYLVLGNAAYCAGSTELTLARLAEVLDDTAAAEAHHRRADERNEAIGARVWLQSATPTSTRVTKTFMFTDIVGSTNLAELLGDEAWGTLLRWHDQTLGELFRAHSGEQVVSTGDGFFVAFEDPEHAIACARAIQQRLADHRATTGFAPEVRIGLHTTEATSEDNNYSGRGVNEAARISALATGGQILASTPTAGSHADPTTARTVTLKGITDPVEIADIPWS